MICLDMSREITPEVVTPINMDSGLVLAQRELPWKTNSSSDDPGPLSDPGQATKGRRYRTISQVSNDSITKKE